MAQILLKIQLVSQRSQDCWSWAMRKSLLRTPAYQAQSTVSSCARRHSTSKRIMINSPHSTWVSGEAINFESGRGLQTDTADSFWMKGRSRWGQSRQNQTQNTNSISSYSKVSIRDTTEGKTTKHDLKNIPWISSFFRSTQGVEHDNILCSSARKPADWGQEKP